MAKDAAERFATIAEFAAALGEGTHAGATPALDSASIVVLPFESMSADPENAFFADGLTEEIITDLSTVRALRVISRSSAMALKGTKRTMAALSAELNVRFVLEGSVRKAGDQLRNSAQLVDATRDAQVWAQRYSGTTQDVFALQERLAREIVAALKVTLTPDEDRQLAAHEMSDVRVVECCAMARREIFRGGYDWDNLYSPRNILINGVLPAIAVILFWVYRQATPGKMLIGAKVVDAKTLGKPSTGQFIGRYLCYYISSLLLCLGFIWVGFDSRKQGWHDKLAGTVVIRSR